jgi:putative ABC transport system permease protein
MSSSRTFQFLLKLLPKDFRSHYGAEMEGVFREQRDAAGTTPAVAQVWATTARDIFSVGLKEHMEQFGQDVRYALRDMRRKPGFIVAAVLTLAVGIGVNAAMFSVLYSVLLRPLPYASPERLVAVWNQWQGQAAGGFSDPEYLDISERSRTMNIAAMTSGAVAIAGDHGDAEREVAGYVTTNMLQVLGTAPMLGRGFVSEEELAGRNHVVILTEALWHKRFNGAHDVVGKTLLVDSTPYVVLGVLSSQVRLPIDFKSDEPVGVILPLEIDRAASRDKRGGHYLQLVGRLNDGQTLGAASAEMNNLYVQMKREYASEYDIPGFAGYLQPLRDDLLGRSRQTLLILCLAVSLVLLLACANVANLMLARGESRRSELAIRIALGASRFRIVRQLVTEGLVLSLAGALVGVALAAICQSVLLHWAANGAVQLPRMRDLSLNVPVLAFTFVLALLTPLLFGLFPALPVTRAAVSDVLSGGGRGSSGYMRPHVRRALMTVQVTIATVLLIASGLLLKSFVRVLQQPSGIRSDHVLTFRVSLPEATYPGVHEISTFYTRLIDNIAPLPGVQSAGASSGLPMAVASGDWSFDIEGRPIVNTKHPGKADWYVVTPGYFESLGISLVSGRLPQASDDESAPPAVFLNETAAKSIFKGENPIGKRMRLTSSTGRPQPWRTIAGVVHDVRQRGLDSPPRPEMYIPHTQFLHFSATGQARSMSIVARSAVDPLTLMPTIRARLASLDPMVPAAQVREMNEVVKLAVADRRMTLDLIGSFGVLALSLALIGVYGVMNYTILQRTREIGVRIALGASRRRVQALIVKDGLRLIVIGIIAGLIVARLFSRVLGSLLFEVKTNDAMVFALVGVVVAAIALLGIYLPARKGSGMDPVVALRVE